LTIGTGLIAQAAVAVPFTILALVVIGLEAAFRRGRMSLRALWLISLGLACAYCTGLCVFLWASGGESWVEGALVGLGIFGSLALLAELVWRMSGRSIVAEILTDRRAQD
jgi:hypothetical protein